MEKKKTSLLTKTAIIFGLILTAAILFGVFYVSEKKTFHVEQFNEVVRPGYETAPAVSKIDISPSLAWDETPKITKALGFLFLIAMWGGIWYVDSDGPLRDKRKAKGEKAYNPWLYLLYTFGPLILSAAFFFGWYVGRAAGNSVTIDKARFDNLVNTGAIEKKSEKEYRDKSDSLVNIFESKELIR